MIRRILLLLWTLGMPATILAQATHITTSGTLPTTCTVGDLYYKTGASAGLKTCSATNTWTDVPVTAAPIDAQYWVGASDSTLTAEKDLSALSTALVINTAGVPSAYTGVTCTSQFIRVLTASGGGTCATISLTADVTGVLPVANGGTGVSAAFAPLLKSTTTLTDAQIKALPTTPITVVTAQGSGFIIRPVGVIYSVHTSAGAYTNVNTTYGQFALTAGGEYLVYGPVNDNTTTPAITLLTQLLTTTTSRVYSLNAANLSYWGPDPAPASLGYVLNNVVNTTATVDNVALVLAADNNGSGNYTGGNAANTMVVTVYYFKEAL